MQLDFEQHPHRRFNPLTGEWIQVSPNRTDRPWQGQEEEAATEEMPEHDPGCYLCPGNTRSGGAKNPEYETTFVFENDFSALAPGTPLESRHSENGLMVAEGIRGTCRVICYSPRHDLTMAEMKLPGIRRVVDVWTEQYAELGSLDYVNYVLIFENKGEIIGVSNRHPHGQMYAYGFIPDEPMKEMVRQHHYYSKHGRTLLGDYLEAERGLDERIILENSHFTVLVPFWAYWPFETMIVARRPFGRFTDMGDEEKEGLADAIKRITVRYDKLFNVSFPYSAGFHPAPTDGEEHPEWHFHMHFYPPLLRSATVRKYRIGSEMFGIPQRDFTPEFSAGKLRELGDR